MSVTVNRTAQRYSGGTTTRSPRMVLLHTTEGVGWPSYNGGAYAPHATIKPIPGKGIEVREHIPFSQSAKALANKSGGVETNRAGVLQFELMGTSDESFHERHGWYYWPRADDAVMKALAQYLKPIMSKYGIPVRCTVTFKDYNRGRVPSSYGRSNGVRMSFSQWNSYKGICGHQHCPENDHGDPGNFKINTLLKYLGGASSAPQPSSGGGSSSFYKPTGTKLSVKQIQGIVGVTQDGAYGPATKKAVAAYQKKIGVTADQLWGPATERAHLAYIGKTSTPKPKPAPKPKPSTPKAPAFPLPKGHYFGPKSGPTSSVSGYYSHRADLRRWQAQMKKRGWKITADGLYGSATARVARAFQKEKGLTVDGKIGPATWAAAWTEKVT